MALYSSILAWKIPWTEEPGGLQSMGPQRVRHSRETEHRVYNPLYIYISHILFIHSSFEGHLVAPTFWLL